MTTTMLWAGSTSRINRDLYTGVILLPFQHGYGFCVGYLTQLFRTATLSSQNWTTLVTTPTKNFRWISRRTLCYLDRKNGPSTSLKDRFFVPSEWKNALVRQEMLLREVI